MNGAWKMREAVHLGINDICHLACCRVGGHIKGSLHLPSASLTDEVLDTTLAQLGSETHTIAVHCMFSKQRGVKAAARMVQRLEEMKKPEKVEVVVLRGGWRGFAQAVATSHPELLDELDEGVQQGGVAPH